MSKEGSTVSGLMDSFATAISLTLQYGVPLDALVDKFSHMRFEPSGFTKNPEIPIAKSLVDYIFRWLGSKFLSTEAEGIGRHHLARQPIRHGSDSGDAKRSLKSVANSGSLDVGRTALRELQADAPACHECGSIMVRYGACYKCLNCGATSGCC